MVNILLVVKRVYYLHDVEFDDVEFVGYVVLTVYIEIEKLVQDPK